jgi:hypothetical protein
VVALAAAVVALAAAVVALAAAVVALAAAVVAGAEVLGVAVLSPQATRSMETNIPRLKTLHNLPKNFDIFYLSNLCFFDKAQRTKSIIKTDSP